MTRDGTMLHSIVLLVGPLFVQMEQDTAPSIVIPRINNSYAFG